MKELGVVAQEALSRAASADGRLIRATQLLDIVDRAVADQTLKRLAAGGYLVRFGRGIYALPEYSKYGASVPKGAEFISALEKTYGEKISDSGAMAALGFHITTQVPVRQIYWTTGKSRMYRFNKLEIEMRHVPQSIAAIEGRWGGAVRAIAARFDSSTDIEDMAKLLKDLSPPDAIFTLRGELGEKVRELYVAYKRVAELN